MRAQALLVVLIAACGGHHHGPPIQGSRRELYVWVGADGSLDDALRAGAREGLAKVRFAVPVDDGAEIEIQANLSRLDRIGRETVCKVRVLVMRLPGHSLLGVADGEARAGGTHDDAAAACVERLVATLVGGKVQVLLRRELRAKR